MNKALSFLRPLRAFLTLWAGQSVSRLGSEMTAFALTIWAFQQQGTVGTTALLSVCHLLPMVLVSPVIGPVVDSREKKRLMLLADSLAAAVSLGLMTLAGLGLLRVPVMYAANALLGVCDAVQSPASAVAVSALVPREHDVRVSALQSLSGSLVSILAPALSMGVLALGGLQAVLLCDLVSFLVGVAALLCTRIPPCGMTQALPFRQALRGGLRFLRTAPGIRVLVGYQVLINLLAGISYYSVLSPMLLLRAGGDPMVPGLVSSFVGVGALAGAALVTLRPARGSLSRTMCVSYCLSFALSDLLMGVGRTPLSWYVAALVGNLPLPLGDGCLMALYRRGIPLSCQGRVFALRGALVQAACVLGYLLGAFLSDRVVPVLSAGEGPAARLIAALVGTGAGRALGILFVMTAVLGGLASLAVWRSAPVRDLERGETPREPDDPATPTESL